VADCIEKNTVRDGAGRHVPCDAVPDKVELAFGLHPVNDQVRPEGRLRLRRRHKHLLPGDDGFDVPGNFAAEHVGYGTSPKGQENLLPDLAVKAPAAANQLKQASAVGTCLFAKIHFVPLQLRFPVCIFN
jgi:hypothetical protein